MMRAVMLNVAFNGSVAGVFVWLNQVALQQQLEETFVALALFYGCIVVIGNALFIFGQKRA